MAVPAVQYGIENIQWGAAAAEAGCTGCVQIEVIKIGDTVTSGYLTGGVKTGLLPGFITLE